MVEKTMTGAEEDGTDDKRDDVTVVEVDAAGKPIEAADEGDARVAADTSDDKGDAPDKGERKRETHQERRERHRRARERDDRERNFLRNEVMRLGQTLERVQGAQQATHSQTIDDRLSEALNEVETAERVMAAATSSGNGEDAVKALRLRDDARNRAIALHNERERMRQPAQQPVTPPPYISHAQKFAEGKEWFTWDQNDPDSARVLAIDSEVAREGYNPMSPAYWNELERRTKEALPHRYKRAAPQQQDDDLDDEDDDEAPNSRRGPPLGSGKQHAPNSTRKEAYISPERKQAMVDAGVWDDPVLRKKYAKAYSEWDRNNSARR